MNTRYRKSHTVGFTLIELIVTVTIILLGLGIVTPFVQHGSAKMDVQTTVQNISSTLRLAHSQAIVKQMGTRFMLDGVKREYWSTAYPRHYHLPNEVQVTLTTTDREISGVRSGAIHFYSDGSSSGGLILIQNKDTKKSIKIDWFTGKVNVQT